MAWIDLHKFIILTVKCVGVMFKQEAFGCEILISHSRNHVDCHILVAVCDNVQASRNAPMFLRNLIPFSP